MPEPTNALLITNPKSRQGATAALDEGLDRLRQAGFQVEHLQSKDPDESRRAVLERCDQLDLVILGGGDGTISSMAGTLYECGIALAVLPLGTANDLARSLGIGSELEDAFAAIVANQRRRIDLGLVNDQYFFNVANMGLGVQVTRELTPEVKRHWGVFSYLKAFLTALMRIRQFKVKLSVDGKTHRLRSIQLAVGNGRYYGGGNIIRDCARINDGKLTLYSIRPQTAWELLTLAPLLRGGQYDLDHRVFTVQGGDMELNTVPRRMDIHADGEPISRTPARFQVLHQALEVVTGPDTAEILDDPVPAEPGQTQFPRGRFS